MNVNNTVADYCCWRRSPWQRMSAADWRTTAAVAQWGHAHIWRLPELMYRDFLWTCSEVMIMCQCLSLSDTWPLWSHYRSLGLATYLFVVEVFVVAVVTLALDLILVKHHTVHASPDTGSGVFRGGAMDGATALPFGLTVNFWIIFTLFL